MWLSQNFKESTNAELKSVTSLPKNKLKKSEIVNQLLLYNIPVNSKLNKNILLQKLQSIKSILAFFTINTEDLIRVQSLWRRKYVNKKNRNTRTRHI